MAPPPPIKHKNYIILPAIKQARQELTAWPLPLFRIEPPRNLTATEHAIFTQLVNGLNTKEICAHFKIALLSAKDHNARIRAKAGVKKTLTLINRYAVRQPGHADFYELITPRQRETINLRAQGLTNAQVAAQLKISTNTARLHVRDAMDRSGLKRLADFARRTPAPSLK